MRKSKRCILQAFMNLEKAYVTIDRHGMWQILRLYGVREKLLKAEQSFYEDSRTCFRVGNDVGLRESCVMSPWLFNVYNYIWMV